MNNDIIRKIYDLFGQLTEQAQIIRVMQLIEMPNDFRPSNYATSYEAKTAIVNWAKNQNKLNELKDEIEYVIGKRNLPSNDPSEQSFEHKCAELLYSLNCDEQRKSFCQFLNEQFGGAFLIEARHNEIQHWLVKCLTDYAQKSDKFSIFSIKVKGKMRYDFDNGLLTELKDVCRIKTSQCVINELTNLGKTQSIIITIYGLRLLTDETKGRFYDLWLDLWERFRSSNQKSCLVLLLVEEDNCRSKLSPFRFLEENNWQGGQQPPSILLPPLTTIPETHVKTWLQTEEVDSQLKLIYASQSKVEFVKTYAWKENDPLNLLQEICVEAFNMQDGFASIESYLNYNHE